MIMATPRATTQLRRLLRAKKFLELPAVYDPLAARIAESLGFKSLYNGGFVTGGMSAISEPLLTMTEQIGVAGNIAAAVKVPLVMDAGAVVASGPHAELLAGEGTYAELWARWTSARGGPVP